MSTTLEHEAALLYIEISNLVEENHEDVPAAYEEKFFAFINKINLGLMADKDNFYGYFLFQMNKEIRLDLSSPTGVNFKRAKYVMYFNPLLFLPMTMAQMESSIKHEILHVVSLHLMRIKDLQGSYSKLALNLAMDIVVNTYLVPLPTDAISLEWVNAKYDAYLVPYESLEYYAEELQKLIDEFDAVDDTPDPDSHSKDKVKINFDPESTHDLWMESDELEDYTMTQFTEKFIDAATKGEVPKYLGNMIGEMKKNAHELPWSWYLKKLMGSIACEQKKTTTRRNRRQPERLDLPGQLRNYKSKIFVALDISGSISDDEFKQAMKEVLQIVRSYHHDMTIIECDDQIRRTYTVKTVHDINERLGIRGGTKYSPVFEYANSKKIDLLVYFTDGKGEDALTVVPKGYKILWVISGDGDELSLAEPYGIVKKLNPLKPKDTFVALYDLERDGYSMNKQEDMALDIDDT